MRKLLIFLRRKHSNLHIMSVAVAVVFVWRGLWGIMDLYLFPAHPLVSYALSIVLGLAILIVIDKAKLEDLE